MPSKTSINIGKHPANGGNNPAIPSALANMKLGEGQIRKDSVFKKNICGDIFGSSMGGGESMLGMMYRSRTRGLEFKSNVKSKHDEMAEETAKDETLIETLDAADSSGSENEITESMNPRQQLAMTIRNWSILPENDAYIIKEGGVHSLIALAGFDDNLIKNCCAGALCHLSSRPENRLELLSIGAATGILSISSNVRSWKLAKLCAMTLCNFSIAKGGEFILVKANAYVALSWLIGIKQHKLLSICAQTLYNLTCVDSCFQNLERVMKNLLVVPVLPSSANGPALHDCTLLQLKALVNCSRYPELRERMIEDGCLSNFAAVVSTIPIKEQHRDEVVLYVVSSLRALSESKKCSSDLISKGTVELLQQLLPYCSEDGHFLVVKTLHNLLRIIQNFPASIYEVAVTVATDLVHLSDNAVSLQYASSCFYTFTKDQLRGESVLTLKVIKALPKLLTLSDPLTQYFSVATSGNLFFNNICEDTKQLEVLVLKFVECGPLMKDRAASQALAVALSKLSQEPIYMQILSQHKKLVLILDLLVRQLTYEFTEDVVVQESGCGAICRIALQVDMMELTTDLRNQIAHLLLQLLETGCSQVLGIALYSIRILADKRICHSEIMQDEKIMNKVAAIAMNFKEDETIPRLCCGVFASFSYDKTTHQMINHPDVIDVLFSLSKNEDLIVREYIATTLCNISITPVCQGALIEAGAVDILSSLSGATCELLQQLCARCICNLTTSVAHHGIMLENKVLQTILMISLVRSVSNITKQLSARALLNMLTEENMQANTEAGVIRAFATLSNQHDVSTQFLCAKGYLLFSSSDAGRQDMAPRRTVLQALFGLVKSTHPETLLLVGKSVFNLLSSPISRMAVVNAGGLSVIKIISTLDFEELRESSARIILNLAQDASLQSCLLREPLVAVLVSILSDSSSWSLECTIHAFSCLAQTEEFRVSMIEKGCISALVGSVIMGRVKTAALCEEICRCLCLLSFVEDKAEVMINKDHILVGINAIYRGKMCTPAAAKMIIIIIRNMSFTTSVCSSIVQQDAFKLMGKVLVDYGASDTSTDTSLCGTAVIALCNICKVQTLHDIILDYGFMPMVHLIATGNAAAANNAPDTIHEDKAEYGGEDSTVAPHVLNSDDIYQLATAIQFMSQTPSCRMQIVKGNAVQILSSFLGGVTRASRYEIAHALSNLASSKECREHLINGNASDLIINLSNSSDDPDTQQQCSLALGYLSEYSKLNSGVMSSLLVLSLKLDAAQQPGGSGKDDATTTSTSHSPVAMSSTALQNSTALRSAIMDGLDRNNGSPDAKHNGGRSANSSPVMRNNSMTSKEKDPSRNFNFRLEEEVEVDPNIALASRQREFEFCKFDYSEYLYQIVPFNIRLEAAGMSKKSEVPAGLPGADSPSIQADQTDRRTELTVVEIIMESLPKDDSCPTTVMQQIGHGHPTESDGRDETVTALAAAKGPSPAESTALRHHRKKAVPSKLRKKASLNDIECSPSSYSNRKKSISPVRAASPKTPGDVVGLRRSSTRPMSNSTREMLSPSPDGNEFTSPTISGIRNPSRGNTPSR